VTLGEYRELRRARSTARFIARMRRRDFMAFAKSRKGEPVKDKYSEVDDLVGAMALIAVLMIVLMLLLHFLGYL
jgi:hypothetical protein